MEKGARIKKGEGFEIAHILKKERENRMKQKKFLRQ